MKSLLTILFCLICGICFAQKDTIQTDTTVTVYGQLAVNKFYAVRYSYGNLNGSPVYKINNKKVTQEFFERLHSTTESLANCKPCILLFYDEKDRLLHKGVQYLDCSIGFWIEYFRNGKVKVIGHYYENAQLDVNNDKNFCQKDGVWQYFNKRGKQIRLEYWEKGVRIK
jgi:hypothetical protein